MPEDYAILTAPSGNKTDPIRICVLDDHPIVHDGLRYLASQTQDIKFCGGAVSGRELETLLRAVTPDILLLDVNLNGENSFAFAARSRISTPISKS